MNLSSIVRLRCPKCLRGRVFKGLFKMHVECPNCGTRFERGPGYFFGAMYFSYALGLIAAAPMCIWMTLAGWWVWWVAAAAVAELAVLSPLLFRYSRVLWMHFDQKWDPR